MKKIEEKNIYSGKLGWIALQGRYFMSSIISEKNEEASMRLFLKPDHILEAEFLQPEQVIQPGSEHFFDFKLFFGPKSMTILNDLGYNLGKAVNFGMFDFIAKPFTKVELCKAIDKAWQAKPKKTGIRGNGFCH